MTRSQRLSALVAAVFGTAGLILAGIVPANAYNTFNDHHLVYGVHNQYYWLDSSEVAAHPNAAPAGVDAWSNTTNTSVYYVRTYTKSQSRLDFYQRSTSSGTYCAITAMYVDTSVVNQNTTNWWWAKVTSDPLLSNASACGSSTHRKGIFAHEMGHAMGLAHNSNSGTLMYTQISSTSVNGPKGDDTNGVNHLY
jgi:hypothetical protein